MTSEYMGNNPPHKISSIQKRTKLNKLKKKKKTFSLWNMDLLEKPSVTILRGSKPFGWGKFWQIGPSKQKIKKKTLLFYTTKSL